MPFALTGNYVSSTYERLVQYLSGSFYDGAGNLLSLNTTSASYSLSSSYVPDLYPQSYQESGSWASESISSSYALNAGAINFIPDLANTASYVLYAISASYAPNISPVNLNGYVLTSSFNNYTSSNDNIVNSLINATSSYITNSQTSSMVVATSSYALFAISASYETNIILSSSRSDTATTASYVSPVSHIEYGMISGSDFTGATKIFDISYTNPYSTNIYIISVIGDDARIWTTNNRTTTGFTINTNSTQPLNGMVMWRAEGNN
jgi:hypothetical protein